jgi:predicted ATP-grasp superfamily ATP-dependent carboligase
VDKSFVSYCRWHRRLDSRVENDPTAESLASFLECLPNEEMVLIPCSDDWAIATSRLTPNLTARFPASIAPPEAVDISLDKGRFANTMARLALPHPRTVSIDASDDVRMLWDSSFRNPFLKPRNSSAFRAKFGTKGFLVSNVDEAVNHVREAQRSGLGLVLQEYVPGPASSHYYVDGFVDRNGRLCARFARRHVRAPAEPFSESSCSVSIPLEEMQAPLEILDRLLPALRYRGVFNAQFKYDERDGLFKLLDLNPRAAGGVAASTACGVNLVEMVYRDALGLPVEPIVRYPTGRYFIHASRDRAACWQLFLKRRFNARAWLRTRIGAVEAIFRWDDPLPAVVKVVHEIRRRIRLW